MGLISELKRRMQLSIIGQETVVERLIIGLLANGNLLVEGLPGLAKTRAIKALANNLEAQYFSFQYRDEAIGSLRGGALSCRMFPLDVFTQITSSSGLRPMVIRGVLGSPPPMATRRSSLGGSAASG